MEPRWLLPGLEVVLLGTMLVLNPVRLTRHAGTARWLSLGLVALISLDNGASAVLLDSKLLQGTAGTQAGPLLASAAAIYLTTSSRSASGIKSSTEAGPSSERRAPTPTRTSCSRK